MKTKEIKRGRFEANYLIKDLKPASVNRDMTKTHSENFKSKLEKFGWLMPITISERGDVIEGHHRVEGAILLGQQTIPAYVVDWINTKEQQSHLNCIITLNNGNKAWTKFDYLKAFSYWDKDYEIVYQAYLTNSNNISVGNVIHCYFRNTGVFKDGKSKIEDKKFGDYLVCELSKLKEEFPEATAAYCVREFINIAYVKANKDIKIVKKLFTEYKKTCRHSTHLATSIKSFRPFMETQTTLLMNDLI